MDGKVSKSKSARLYQANGKNAKPKGRDQPSINGIGCTDCRAVLPTKRAAANHAIIQKHMSSTLCVECKWLFEDTDALRQHHATEHNSPTKSWNKFAEDHGGSVKGSSKVVIPTSPVESAHGGDDETSLAVSGSPVRPRRAFPSYPEPPTYPQIKVIKFKQVPYGGNEYTIYKRVCFGAIEDGLRLRAHETYMLSTYNIIQSYDLSPPGRFAKVPRGSMVEHFSASPDPEPTTSVNPNKKRRALALDCEMVSIDLRTAKEQHLSRDTNSSIPQGDALAQLAVVDILTGEVLINSLVIPQGRVIDWRTRYSGVTKKAMATAHREGSALDGWHAARATLFTFMDADTVLVGHNIKADLDALRVAHSCIMDTAIVTGMAVFGKPSGRRLHRHWGLRDLALQFLETRVQTRHGSKGHDCLEDALVTRELALYCIVSPELLNGWGRRTRSELKKKWENNEQKRYEDALKMARRKYLKQKEYEE